MRVRLSGRLPDATIEGRRVVRGDDVGGLMLYDDKGVERGGYVTFNKSGNVALTLDTRRKQVVLLAADPADGAVIKLWRGDDWVEMRSGSDGSRLTTGQAGAIETAMPTFTASEQTELCSGLRTGIAKMPSPPSSAVIMQACSTRMPAAACRTCLDSMTPPRKLR